MLLNLIHLLKIGISVRVVGNSWGICENGTGAIGCGAQENFRGCSDIRVLGAGNSNRFNIDTSPEGPANDDTLLSQKSGTKQEEISKLGSR